jgi:putative flippase GtrA
MGAQDIAGTGNTPDTALLQGKNGKRMILDRKKEQERFLKFLAVGMIGAVIDFGTFNVLTVFFHLPALVAQIISFTLAVTSNFIWNRFWTYPDSRNKAVVHQLVQFFFVNMIGLGIRTLIFNRLEESMIWLSGQVVPKNFFVSTTVIGHNLSLATVIIIIMFWNFFVNRFWTYNDVT